MPKVKFDISVSLDGYVAGPNPTLDDPLGKNGELLHEWAYPTVAFNVPHGRDGGETGVDNDVMAEVFEGVGASILGRRMFSGGAGPWEDDSNPDAWWGDEPPFHHPVFVVTHHEREPLAKRGTTFTFVTDGIESALAQAREAADGKDVAIGGGASVAQQYLAAGLIDEMQLHVVPVLLGGGVRLFDGPAADAASRLELMRAIESPTGTMHLQYRSTSSLS